MATKTKKYRGEKKNPYTRNHCIYKAVLKPEHRTAKDEGRKCIMANIKNQQNRDSIKLQDIPDGNLFGKLWIRI